MKKTNMTGSSLSSNSLNIYINIFLVFIVLCSIKSYAGGGESEKFRRIFTSQFDSPVYNNFELGSFFSELKVYSENSTPISRFSEALKTYYTLQKREPLWVGERYASGETDSLLHYLKTARLHGISPELFHVSEIQRTLDSLRSEDFQMIRDVYPLMARLEVLCSSALVNYAAILQFGLTNPANKLRDYPSARTAMNKNEMIALISLPVVETLKGVQPTDFAYIQLASALIVCKDVSQRQKILVTMERLRWRSGETGISGVIVNIPDYSLTVSNGKDSLLRMKACVGSSPGRKGDHRTPLLSSKIHQLQINPVWNIPFSIASKEILPMLKKDKGYLLRKGIDVYLGGSRLSDPTRIKWSAYSSANFPFSLKQRPGRDNAMGKYKFAFYNNMSIFLHDTNNRKGFDLNNRALSHGCVRVEKPFELAKAILMVADREEQKAFRNAVKSNKTIILNLKRPVPIQITYQTAFIRADKVEFGEDVYHLDKYLLDLLRTEGLEDC